MEKSAGEACKTEVTYSSITVVQQEMFAKSWSRKKQKQTTVVAILMLVACLFVKIIQHWSFAFADLLWPCIKV